MVIRPQTNAGQCGVAIVELVAAMVILVSILLPLSFSFVSEQKLCRAYYHQAIAMEIVDGEMEILKAGEWQEFKGGRQDYPVRAGAATNLPPGRFTLTVEGRHYRLEWMPDDKGQGGRVVREMEVR